MIKQETIAARIEALGWTRATAGDADFDAAVRAVGEARAHGMGLIVSGTYGCGKTRLVQAILAAGRPARMVRLGVPSDLVMLRDDWMEYYAESLYRENVFLDDLGAEYAANEYGVRIEPVTDFISRWHDEHAEDTRLFITTNLTAAELDARYGGRLLSRLKDLCVPLKLAGSDKRKWVMSGRDAKGGAK